MIFFLMSLSIFMTGCTDKGYQSVEDALQSEGIQNEQIYLKQELKDDVVFIYANPLGGVDAGLVKKAGNRYQWSIVGGVSLPSNGKDVTWNWVNLDSEERYQFYVGIVKEQSITRLHIEHAGPGNYINKNAEIVELDDGSTLWFALQDKDSPVQPGFILDGFNKEGDNVIHYEAKQGIR